MSVFSIGEALIDFLPFEQGFFPVVGGAPANVAACIAKLQGSAYFIGKVGNDMFGEKIINELSAAGVNTNYLTKTDTANTALAFVSLKENGEREFAFYRKPSADMFLDKSDLENIKFISGDKLHFCSVDLVDMPVRYATKAAIEKMKAAGGYISFDPNLRKNLWNDLAAYKKIILEYLNFADIIKFSDDEIDFLFNTSDYESVAAEYLKKGTRIVIVTLGAKGSKAFTNYGQFFQLPFAVKSVDTTGAGDSYIGTFLNFIDPENIAESIPAAMKYASAVSALVCAKKGVLTSLPTIEEVINFIG